MIGFTDRARDGSKYDPALTLPRTGSDSSPGFFSLAERNHDAHIVKNLNDCD